MDGDTTHSLHIGHMNMDTRTNTITSLYTKLLAALDTAQSQSPSPVVQGCQIFCHGESWLASLTGAELLEIQRAVTYQMIENEGRAPKAPQAPQAPQAQEPQAQEPQAPQAPQAQEPQAPPAQEPPAVEALCQQADAIMAKPVYQAPAKPKAQAPAKPKAQAPAKPKAPTIADLKALCKQHGIKGYSRLSKGDLILKLRGHGIETV